LAEECSGQVLVQYADAATHIAVLNCSTDTLSVTFAPSTAFRCVMLQPLDPRSSVARAELIDPGAAERILLRQEAADRVLHALYMAQAADLWGIAEAALLATVSYVVERRQFGRPIGQFQGV